MFLAFATEFIFLELRQNIYTKFGDTYCILNFWTKLDLAQKACVMICLFMLFVNQVRNKQNISFKNQKPSILDTRMWLVEYLTPFFSIFSNEIHQIIHLMEVFFSGSIFEVYIFILRDKLCENLNFFHNFVKTIYYFRVVISF